MYKVMDGKDFIEICRAAQDGGDADMTVRRYSGRGMYGRQCVGVDVGRGDTFRALAQMTEAAKNAGDDAFDEWVEIIMPNTNQDSMGLGTILYWPHMAWPEDMTEETGEEEEEE